MKNDPDIRPRHTYDKQVLSPFSVPPSPSSCLPTSPLLSLSSLLRPSCSWLPHTYTQTCVRVCSCQSVCDLMLCRHMNKYFYPLKMLAFTVWCRSLWPNCRWEGVRGEGDTFDLVVVVVAGVHRCWVLLHRRPLSPSSPGKSLSCTDAVLQMHCLFVSLLRSHPPTHNPEHKLTTGAVINSVIYQLSIKRITWT